jgi:hypothetical protein
VSQSVRCAVPPRVHSIEGLIEQPPAAGIAPGRLPSSERLNNNFASARQSDKNDDSVVVAESLAVRHQMLIMKHSSLENAAYKSLPITMRDNLRNPSLR